MMEIWNNGVMGETIFHHSIVPILHVTYINDTYRRHIKEKILNPIFQHSIIPNWR